MSDATNSNKDVRQAIRETIQTHKQITVSELAEVVAADIGCPDATVVKQIDKLDHHGFVYLDGDDAGEMEVRLA